MYKIERNLFERIFCIGSHYIIIMFSKWSLILVRVDRAINYLHQFIFTIIDNINITLSLSIYGHRKRYVSYV